MAISFQSYVIRSMPPATAQNRPLYINFNPGARGQLYEYRPAHVNGVLQWVLRPVYHLAYWIQRLIRWIRAGCDFWMAGYQVLPIDGSELVNLSAYMVDLEVPRLIPGVDF